MSQFKHYNDSIFCAFQLHTKSKEIADKKEEIISKVSEHFQHQPSSILFVGFNPAILKVQCKEIYVTEVSDSVLYWLQNQRADIKLFERPRKFDYVVAFDEYLTFAENETEQLNNINNLCKLASKMILTTVKDYKNQDFKDREYSQPAIIKSTKNNTAYIEIHNWSQTEKNSWTTNLYSLADSTANYLGSYNRKALFFKQLAKFSIDSGAKNFLVHKNLMYKSIIKKNYEHVISIIF